MDSDEDNMSSSRGTARAKAMTQQEEDMLSEEQFQQLYEGLPQVPANVGFGRTMRRFCATLAYGAQWLSDSVWVARNLDKSDTCFALSSRGYDPNKSDIQNAHSAVQASTRWRSSPEGERAKMLRDMAGDIQWAASTALQAELQSLILEDNIEGDNGAGCGRILEVLLSNSGGQTLEHRSKITSLMVIIYASQIIMMNTSAQYEGGPKYIGDQVVRLLGRDVAAEYSQLITTDNDKRYINVMYGWLFALIFDRNPANAPRQDIIPFPTNMWGISYLAMRFSSQHFYDYGHTLQYEMGRALKITNRALLSSNLRDHFALHYRDGTPAGSYSKPEIVALVEMFQDEPFPISEISMGQWIVELSDEIKANSAQLPIANAERLAQLKSVIDAEDSFVSSRKGKQVASMDALDPNRPSIFNRGERVERSAVGSSQDPDMFGPGGHISEQMEYDEEAEKGAEDINVTSLKEKFRSISFLIQTEQVPPNRQGTPFHTQLYFRGPVSQASSQIVAAANPRTSKTSRNALQYIESPKIPHAPPFENQFPDQYTVSSSAFANSSATPSLNIPSIGERVQASVKNMSSSNAATAIVTGTVVSVGRPPSAPANKPGIFVGICLDLQYVGLYGKHNCDGKCPASSGSPTTGIYVPLKNVEPIQDFSSSATASNANNDYNIGGRRRRKTRKIKRSRKTKKAKKAKKSKKSRRSRK